MKEIFQTHVPLNLLFPFTILEIHTGILTTDMHQRQSSYQVPCINVSPILYKALEHAVLPSFHRRMQCSVSILQRKHSHTGDKSKQPNMQLPPSKTSLKELGIHYFELQHMYTIYMHAWLIVYKISIISSQVSSS